MLSSSFLLVVSTVPMAVHPSVLLAQAESSDGWQCRTSW